MPAIAIQKKEQELQAIENQHKADREKLIQEQNALDLQQQALNQEKNKFEVEKAQAYQQIQSEKMQIEQTKRELQVLQNKLIQSARIQQQSNLQQTPSKTSNTTVTTTDLLGNNPQKSDTEKAQDFLAEEFRKGQEFYYVKLADLIVEKKIGFGASAEVYKGTYKEMDVAIKKLHFNSNQEQDVSGANPIKEFKREISTLMKVRHPNLVMFVGASVERGHVVIVTEYCFGGSLFSLLHEKRSQVQLTVKQKFRMLFDVAKGLNFLHTQEPHPILHRDLKSLNLLACEPVNGPDDFVQAKITDFGLARDLLHPGGNHEELQTNSAGQLTNQAGTFHWMAPEVLKSDKYTTKADVYSYGIVLWEIFCREPPFKSWKPYEIMQKVVDHGARPDLTKIPSDIPKPLILVMERCWAQKPEDRPNMSEVVKALKNMQHII